MGDKSNRSVICTLFKIAFLEKWDERAIPAGPCAVQLSRSVYCQPYCHIVINATLGINRLTSRSLDEIGPKIVAN